MLFLQFARIRFKTFCHISETIGPIDLSVNALCSARWAAPTAMLFLQFARKGVLTFCHISETIRPIDLSVNALCSAGWASPTALSFLQFARISVLSILSYLRHYWANRPECQRVVHCRLGCADYTVVSSICKNKVLNILSYLRNYWANRPECQRVVLSRLRCADCNVVSSICKNKCFKHFVISQKLLGQSTWVSTRCARQVALRRIHCCFFNMQE